VITNALPTTSIGSTYKSAGRVSWNASSAEVNGPAAASALYNPNLSPRGCVASLVGVAGRLRRP
jgi:hypothetical protein